MNERKCYKISAYGTVISGLCCLGLLGFLLGAFGATTALLYVNKFGDFLFLPTYGIFGTLLVHSLLKLGKNWRTYTISTVIIALAIYVSLSAVGAALMISGILIGIITIAILQRRSSS